MDPPKHLSISFLLTPKHLLLFSFILVLKCIVATFSIIWPIFDGRVFRFKCLLLRFRFWFSFRFEFRVRFRFWVRFRTAERSRSGLDSGYRFRWKSLFLVQNMKNIWFSFIFRVLSLRLNSGSGLRFQFRVRFKVSIQGQV